MADKQVSIQSTENSNIKNYIDMMMTNKIMSLMTTNDKTDKYGVKMILGMLLLSSTKEIKTFASSTLYSINLYIWNYVCFIMSIYRKVTDKNIKKIQLGDHLKFCEYNMIVIEVEISGQFMDSLYNYMINDKDECSYIKSNTYTMTIENLEDRIVTESYNNIQFKLEGDVMIEINQEIIFGLQIKKNNTKVIKSNVSSKFEEITSLTELIFDPMQRNAFIRLYNEIKRKAHLYIGKDNESLYDYTGTCMYKKPLAMGGQPGIADNILRCVKKSYKNIPDIVFYNELLIMLSIYKYCIKCGDRFNNLIKCKKNNPDVCYTLVFGITIVDAREHFESHWVLSLLLEEDKKTFNPYLEKIDNYLKTHPITENNNDVSENNVIRFSVYSKIKDEMMLYDIFNSFIQKFNNVRTNKSNKIKMNHLLLKKTEVVEEIPNPEYEEYLERKNVLGSDGIEESVKRMALSEFMKMPIPCKTLKSSKIKKEIQCIEINEISKDLSTLYLREDDIFKLKNCLDIFNDKQELMSSLGIPHKLGIMLHGLPGTGKTSTIHASATYLQKDLYYVSLNELETNDELQMMFDYVSKNYINGGIIVLEDIDAMSDVVHKRLDETKESNLSELMDSKQNKLTLEYFLNILQGSLTKDGTIFMVTTNHLDIIDPAFYRDGRFDINIEMKKCDHHQINMIYRNFFKKDIPSNLMQLIKEDEWTPANIIFHIKNYMFGNFTDEQILKKFLQ